LDSNVALAQLKGEVDAWVTQVLPAVYPKLPLPSQNDTKVIREAVTGYQVLQPHEYIILDCPLMQRLRFIHQTALAYLVYPTANHTRFDHSLGCAKIAQEIGEHIIPDKKTNIAELRLAALLHDIGHSFFSHLSESIMQSRFHDLYLSVKRAPTFKDLDLGLGEILSYLVVKSERFQQFIDSVVHHYPKYG